MDRAGLVQSRVALGRLTGIRYPRAPSVTRLTVVARIVSWHRSPRYCRLVRVPGSKRVSRLIRAFLIGWCRSMCVVFGVFRRVRSGCRRCSRRRVRGLLIRRRTRVYEGWDGVAVVGTFAPRAACSIPG